MSSREYNIGDGWGHAINWLHPEQFSKDHNSDTRFSVVGWQRYIPQIGDILVGEFENSTRTFKFVSVRPCNDPTDMFFADVKCVKVTPKAAAQALSGGK